MSPRPDLGPKPRLGYAGSRIDRAAERRADAARSLRSSRMRQRRALRDRRRDGGAEEGRRGSRSAVHAGGGARASRRGGDGVSRPASTARRASRSRSTRRRSKRCKAREDFTVTDLRSIAVRGLVDAEHLPPLAEGKALLGWHARHRFCSNCGAPTQPVDAGWRRDCAGLQDAAFSAHRSGRHHARDRRRALPARPLAPLPAPACGRASRASSSRARPSRMRCGANCARRPASSAGAWIISPRSRGRFRPR